MLGLLALGGCGSIANLATGPQVYGGVRHDLVYVGGSSCLPIRWTCDIPFSAALDTGLLPVTLIFEGIRCATGWPPKGVPTN